MSTASPPADPWCPQSDGSLGELLQSVEPCRARCLTLRTVPRKRGGHERTVCIQPTRLSEAWTGDGGRAVTVPRVRPEPGRCAAGPLRPDARRSGSVAGFSDGAEVALDASSQWICHRKVNPSRFGRCAHQAPQGVSLLRRLWVVSLSWYERRSLMEPPPRPTQTCRPKYLSFRERPGCRVRSGS